MKPNPNYSPRPSPEAARIAAGKRASVLSDLAHWASLAGHPNAQLLAEAATEAYTASLPLPVTAGQAEVYTTS